MVGRLGHYLGLEWLGTLLHLVDDEGVCDPLTNFGYNLEINRPEGGVRSGSAGLTWFWRS